MNTAAAEKKNYAFIEGKESSACAPGTDWNSYKKAIKEIESLSKEEEKALFEDVEKGKTAAALLSGKASANGTAARALEEEALASGDRRAMLKEIKERGERARERILEACAPRIAYLAEESARMSAGTVCDMGEGDFFSAGAQELAKAIDKFKPERGCRMWSFAEPVVRCAMRRAKLEQRNCVRRPVWLQEEAFRIRKTRERLGKELRRAPSDYEVAESMGVPVARLRKIEGACLREVSLDAPQGGEERAPLGSYFRDEAAGSPEAYVEKREMRKEVRKLLRLLDSAPRKVVVMYYGFGCKPRSLQEIGSEFGKSREWARRLFQKALDMLRPEAEERGLRAFLKSA